ncbi:MAG: DUF4339 domain-containing protein [Acidobacteriota bacterium]|nr:DUF4339 domain-containing protein [Acidobacteriota bacterium]
MEEFRVTRDGQTFGPYTEADLRQYLASGNIVETDLVRSKDTDKWVPLKKVIPRLDKSSAATARLMALRMDLPAPPDIPWWMAMVLEVFTALTFFVGWDVFEAVWLYRVQRGSRALLYYSIAALLFIVNSQATYSIVMHDVFGRPSADNPHATLLGIAAWGMRIVARFSMRHSLLEHFNKVEPIGLKLSWWRTLLFGGLYFQYHFNLINEMRRARVAMTVRG